MDGVAQTSDTLIEQSTFMTTRTARLERCGGMYIILMVSQFRPLDMKQPTVSVGRDLPSRVFGRRRFSRIDDVANEVCRECRSSPSHELLRRQLFRFGRGLVKAQG